VNEGGIKNKVAVTVREVQCCCRVERRVSAHIRLLVDVASSHAPGD